MGEGGNVTIIIPLENYQISFTPKIDGVKFLFIFTLFFLLFLFRISGDAKTVVLLSLFFSVGLTLTLFEANYPYYPKGEENFFFNKKDKAGKTREDKVSDFWEKVLSSQDEIRIKKINATTEKYMVNKLPAEILERESCVEMIWRDTTLFEKDNEGDVTHLEGMPSILFLRD